VPIKLLLDADVLPVLTSIERYALSAIMGKSKKFIAGVRSADAPVSRKQICSKGLTNTKASNPMSGELNVTL
jgi:hypothetical protein